MIAEDAIVLFSSGICAFAGQDSFLQKQSEERGETGETTPDYSDCGMRKNRITALNHSKQKNGSWREVFMVHSSFPDDWKGMPFLVVCCSAPDEEKAAGLIQSFLEMGMRFRVHSDPETLQSAAWETARCGAFICIVSGSFLSDSFCTGLLRIAAGKRRTIITVLDGDPEVPAELKSILASAVSYRLDSFPDSETLTQRIMGENRRIQVCQIKDLHKDASGGFSSWGGFPDDFSDFSILGILEGLKNGSIPKSAFPVSETAQDSVSFSILSPKAVKKDTYGIINLHMYTEAQREAVERAIRESSTPVNVSTKSGLSVKRKTFVTARLESGTLEIANNIDTQLWNGEALNFDFMFYVPEDYSRTQAAFVCHIEYNGIPVTRMNFLVSVVSDPEPGSIPAKVVRSDYTKAFISYSRKDEERMLARVIGIQELAPEMKFWLDKQSMAAGDFWRDEIREAIRISDVLLLFWSLPASKSAEVEKEWRYGLEQKGLSFIAPVPLDPPDQCPPPEPLQALNFTVRAFNTDRIPGKLSFYDSHNMVVL